MSAHPARALWLAACLAGVAGALPLCRVKADSRPGLWASSFRTLTVTLAPDCPPDGVALIHLGAYGGPGSKRVGPAVRLDKDHPVIVFGAQPVWRTVLWEALSGKLWRVQIPQEVPGAPED